jgi:hypothetical protein
VPPMTPPETYSFEAAGGFPNSRLPVLVYHDVQEAGAAGACEPRRLPASAPLRPTKRARVHTSRSPREESRS